MLPFGLTLPATAASAALKLLPYVVAVAVGMGACVGLYHAGYSSAETVFEKQAAETALEIARADARAKERDESLTRKLIEADANLKRIENESATNLAAVVADNQRLRLAKGIAVCTRDPGNGANTAASGRASDSVPASAAASAGTGETQSIELLPGTSRTVLAAIAGCAKAVRERNELTYRYETARKSVNAE